MSIHSTHQTRTVLITGAGRGIGRALAATMAAAGWTVLGTVRDPSQGADLVDDAEVHLLDVTDPASIAQLAAALAGRPLDVLVNNAGTVGPQRQSSLDMDFDGFARTLEVNTLGPLRVTQALLANLRAAAPARLVNVSSRMGSLSYAKSDTTAYRASKAALNKVTQCLATDLAAEGIAVAAVHPGWVRTDIGGPQADIDAGTCADGLHKVIEGLNMGTAGRFFDYLGNTLDW